jgi:hypothetical protein
MESSKGINKKTWRSQKIQLIPNQITVVQFKDTKPNVAQIRNNSNDKLYLSPFQIVSTSEFELSIGEGITRVYSNPVGFEYLYFYSSTADIIIINSAEVENMSAYDLDEINVSVVQNYASTPNVDINNINTPLPAGTNNIGHVIVDGYVNVNRDNFTPLKVTIPAGESVTIKDSSGYIAKIQTSLTDLILKNNGVEIWSGNADYSPPIYCNINIVLESVTGGIAYISYK